jgi:hypothetical protein
MTPRRPYRRRPKDILTLSLKALTVNDEIICSVRTYNNIRTRLSEFQSAHDDRSYKSDIWHGIRKIKRVA